MHITNNTPSPLLHPLTPLFPPSSSSPPTAMSSSSDESSYGGGPSNVSKFPLHDVCDSPNDDVEELKKYLFMKTGGKKTGGFGFDDR